MSPAIRPWIVSLILGGLMSTPRAASAEAKTEGRLLVLIVVDQLGSHYLRRWGHLTNRGFGRLARRGATYRRGRFLYANTETAAGHATITTGAWPNIHGLVANRWYEPSGAEVYCVSDPKHGRSPRNLMAPGIADAIRLATQGKGKTISFSLKDRAAIALGGTRPDLAGWYSIEAGRMVAGQWPGMKAPPSWFKRVALERTAASSFGGVWKRARSDVDYRAEAGRDDHASEFPVEGVGRTFPHALGPGTEGPTSELWRDAWRSTPASVDVLVELATTALEQERLGQRGTIDYLGIGFTTLDIAGHWWGSHAQETLDVLLRIDMAIGRLIAAVEARLGEGRAIFVVTGDHGSMPTPEEVAAYGVRSVRIPSKALVAAADAALQRDFPREKLRVLDLNPPRIYLSATAPGFDRSRAARRVAEAIAKVDGIVDAVATADLAQWPEPLRTMYARSLFVGRNPDVLLLHRAHEMVDAVDAEGHGLGTGHGSPYGYDTTVPILLAGPGVRRITVEGPRPMTRLAPSMAALLSIEPPAAAMDVPLDAVR